MAPDSWFVANAQLEAYHPRFREEFTRLVRSRFSESLVVRAMLAIGKTTWNSETCQSVWEEEIEYQGRRLAKLGVLPEALIDLLMETLAVGEDEQGIAFRSACDVVVLSARLHLDRALQQVREAESALLSGLFQRQLEASTPGGIVRGALEAMRDYTGAETARAWLRNETNGTWVLSAQVPARAPLRSTPLWFNSLSEDPKPRCVANRRGTHWRFPLLADTHELGWIELGFSKSYPWLPREREVLEASSALCALAVRRAQLASRLANREAQILHLLEQLVAVEEAERKRIARDLHDEAGQSLMCLRLQLELLDRDLHQRGADGTVRQSLTDARQFADRSIRDIRRVIAALSPSVLEQLGLCAAIRHLVTRFCELHSIQVECNVPDKLDLPRNLDVAVFRLVQECLNNIGKHAQATKVMIWLETADGRLRIVITDNGVGFDVAAKASQPGCFGVAGIRDRVSFLSGQVTIRSRRGKRSGTTVEIELPFPAQPGEAANLSEVEKKSTRTPRPTPITAGRVREPAEPANSVEAQYPR